MYISLRSRCIYVCEKNGDEACGLFGRNIYVHSKPIFASSPMPPVHGFRVSISYSKRHFEFWGVSAEYELLRCVSRLKIRAEIGD